MREYHKKALHCSLVRGFLMLNKSKGIGEEGRYKILTGNIRI